MCAERYFEVRPLDSRRSGGGRGGAKTLASAVVAAWLGLFAATARAGGGPTDYLVVYDPRDPSSVAIANYYQRARAIPECNLLAYEYPLCAPTLPSFPNSLTYDQAAAMIATLKAHLASNGLTGQIDGIVLAGLSPTCLDQTKSITAALYVGPNITNGVGLSSYLASAGGVFINGAYTTSLSSAAEVRIDKTYAGRKPDLTTSSDHYWLSAVLGYTGLAGNTPDEAFAQIDRAVSADGSFPEGTLYWPMNGDVRALMRAPQIAGATTAFDALGLTHWVYGNGYGGVATAESIPKNKTGAPGSAPTTERAAIGALVGASGFNVPGSGTLYLPGAIAEHVTSFGGEIGDELYEQGQTKCSGWVRAGAAGTGGTVTEPSGAPESFPHAMMHAFYGAGASLGEAFHLSLQWPRLYMVYGDPLTQPYARAPSVVIDNVSAGQVLSGTTSIAVTASSAVGLEANLDLVVDGRIVRIGDPAETVGATRTAGGFSLNTATLPDGHHELRIIAYSANAFRNQGFDARDVRVNNQGRNVTLTGPVTGDATVDVNLNVVVSGIPDVVALALRASGRELMALPLAGGAVALPGRLLGYKGRNHVYAVATRAGGQKIWSPPIAIDMSWTPRPPASPAKLVADAVGHVRYFSNATAPGFDWTQPASAAAAIDDRMMLEFATPVSRYDNSAKSGGLGFPFMQNKANTTAGYEITTLYQAAETAQYDLCVQVGGTVAGVVVDGELLPGSGLSTRLVNWTQPASYYSVNLKAGLHRIAIRMVLDGVNSEFNFGIRDRYTYVQSFDKGYIDYTALYNRAVAGHPANACAPLFEATAPVLTATGAGAGSASLAWTDRTPAETGFVVEEHAGAPGVSLLEYAGSGTTPVIAPRNSADSFRLDGRCSVGSNTSIWTRVPDFLLGAECLRVDPTDAAQLSLYRVQVPAGTRIYAVTSKTTPSTGDFLNDGTWELTPRRVSTSAASPWPESYYLWRRTTVTAADGSDWLGKVSTPVAFVFVREPEWNVRATLGSGVTAATLSGLADGPHTFRVRAVLDADAWQASNEQTVNTGAAPANRAPIAEAGRALRVVLPDNALSLAGSVADDGLPANVLTSAWSVVGGPGAVVFANAAAPTTQATFTTPGVYVLRLTAFDGTLQGADTATVTVLPGAVGNTPPVVGAGPDTASHVAQVLTLSGSATDDGLPNPPARLATRWSRVSGPRAVSFLDAASLSTKAVFVAPGTYVLRLTASDGAEERSDDLAVTVAADPNAAPQVSAGPDRNVFLGQLASLAGTIIDDGLPNPPSTVQKSWGKLSGPGTVTFGNASLPATAADFSSVGTYLLYLKAFDGARTVADSVQVTVAYDPSGNQRPVLQASANPASPIFPVRVALAATGTDDGKPSPPAALTYGWSQVSGPTTATIQNPSSANATAFFTWPGEYSFEASVTDGTLSDWRQVSVRVRAASSASSYAFTWGQHLSYGVLGDGLAANRYYPAAVLYEAVDVAGGLQFSIAALGDGRVRAWGRNQYGQLGDATKTDRALPVAVAAIANATRVSAGSVHSVALGSGGEVWTWGANTYGAIGNGTSGTGTETNRPYRVTGIPEARSIAAGAYFCVIAGVEGSVWGWGRNGDGQIGDGTTTQAVSPQPGLLTTGVTMVAAGTSHALALKSDGTVWAWGLNSDGQLGNNTTTPSLTPVQANGLSGVTAIAAGPFHSLALKSDGTVWAWGDNAFSQLGDDTTTDRLKPTKTSSLTGVAAIAGGRYHSLAVKGDGSLWGWGANTSGQLGTGNLTNSKIPVRARDTGLFFTRVFGGQNHALGAGRLIVDVPLAVPPLALSVDGGAMVLDVPETSPAWTYTLLSTTNLVTGPWTESAPTVGWPNGGSMEWDVPQDKPQEFFRLRVTEP